MFWCWPSELNLYFLKSFIDLLIHFGLLAAHYLSKRLTMSTTETPNSADKPTNPDDPTLLCKNLKDLCTNNIEFFKHKDSVSGQRLFGAFTGIIDHTEHIETLMTEVADFVHHYDFDAATPGNGYRSFLFVGQTAIQHSIKTARYVTDNRANLLFRQSHFMKEIEACHHLLASLCTCIRHLITLHEWTCDTHELFPHESHTVEDLLARAETINQYSFYGRCLGFQFCESMKPLLKFVSISMAGFSESYYSEDGSFTKATSSMYASGKYFLDPELRARRIVNISQSASVEFCKSFWFLAETEIMQTLPSVVCAKMKINKVFKIPPEPLTVPHVETGELISIPVPSSHLGVGPVFARLMSANRREGMVGERKNRSSRLQPSSGLILHAHGGGFIAQSSKSHELYLREWAAKLDVPILSIDYSLAPQAPFPRASEEVFYAYCWALNNCHLLGWTGERIILAGDSAGANLGLSCTIRAINMGIRKPDGLFLAYCPVMVSFVPSPARLLCLMDPLLPFGFMMRCLKAYTHPTEEVIAANRKRVKELDEIRYAKAVPKSLNNNTVSFSSLPSSMSLLCNNETVTLNGSKGPVVVNGAPTMSTCSSGDNSMWEQICMDSNGVENVDKRLSPVSGASSDTFAGASFKSQDGSGNTIEIISPGESNTATSLEEDSQPITWHRSPFQTTADVATTEDETVAFDLPNKTSDSKTDSNQYVSEFIERYVLDSTTGPDGEIRPILKPVHRSQSDENIVFDIGRETMSVQNLQERFQKAAGNIVNAVSNTFSHITSSKKIRTSNSCSSEDYTKNLDALIVRSASDEFIFDVPKNPLISPYFAGDDVMRQMPATKIVSLVLDPCLDDCVMFAKKLKKFNVNVGLDIIPGLPHGFLNFCMFSKEAHDASKLCMDRLAELLQLPEPDENRRTCF